MAMAVNAAKARLKKNQLAVGIGVRLVRNVDIIKVMKAAGFDWLFLDLEHGVMGIENAAEICVAAQDSGIAPIVRVPYGELAMATRLLDGGALGIVIPHVDTAEEAKEIADRPRYPPLGHRSVGGGQAQFDYAPMKMADMIKRANDNVLVTVMIETPKAVKNAEAIAAVPGIDSLLVGSSDLSVELGIPGENGHEKIQAAVDKVVAACKKHKTRHGRRLLGGAFGALYRQGHEAPAGRQRPADADRRRAGPSGQGAGDGEGEGAESEEEVAFEPPYPPLFAGERSSVSLELPDPVRAGSLARRRAELNVLGRKGDRIPQRKGQGLIATNDGHGARFRRSRRKVHLAEKFDSELLRHLKQSDRRRFLVDLPGPGRNEHAHLAPPLFVPTHSLILYAGRKGVSAFLRSRSRADAACRT